MASMGATQVEFDLLVARVKNAGLLNKTLQAICSNEGLNKNGIKAELQQRIIDSMLHLGDDLDWSLARHYSQGFTSQLLHEQELTLSRSAGLARHRTQQDSASYNRLKRMIENPNSTQPGGSQYGSMTNSASPAAAVTPGAYLGVSGSGYNMGGGVNNYRPGGGHQSKLILEVVM